MDLISNNAIWAAIFVISLATLLHWGYLWAKRFLTALLWEAYLDGHLDAVKQIQEKFDARGIDIKLTHTIVDNKC